MKTIETNILIQAPASAVWQALMDFDNYPNWNPFIQQIKGAPEVGNNIEIKIFNGTKEFNFKPKVLANNPQQEFRWKGKMFFKGLFDGEHCFILHEKVIDGKQVTGFTHKENFTGILVGMILKSIGESTREGFIAMNEALKKEAERISSENNVKA